MRIKNALLAVIASSSLVIVLPSISGAAQSKCDAAKVTAAGKKAAARAKCYANALKKDLPVDPSCLAAAQQKFATAFQKADAKADNCTNFGDSMNVETTIDQCVTDLVSQVNTPPSCTRAQDCPAGHVCTAGECVDVTSGSVVASLIASSYLTDQCLAPVHVGGDGLFSTSADACNRTLGGCAGCQVDVVADTVTVTAPAPGTWTTAPMLNIDVQFDASTHGPVSYKIVGVAGSCTFDLSRTDVTATIVVSFAPDGTPTATTDAAALGISARETCPVTEAPVAEAVDAIDVELTAALDAQIEAIRLALETFLQP